MDHPSPAPALPALPASVGVLVIGAGLAGLAAAIEARQAGASVLLLDAAPAARLGGNARHGRNIRLANGAETAFQRDTYPAAEFRADLARIGGPDPRLAEVLAEGSVPFAAWVQRQGVRLEPWAEGNLPYSRRTVFLRGGGQAMVNALVSRALLLGVEIRADCPVADLPPEAFDPRHDAPLRVAVGAAVIAAGAVVLASGGTGGNRAEMARSLGPRAAHLANRGTPEQIGAPLLSALAQGAAVAGTPGDGHIVAVDPRAPADDAGIVSRVDGMQFGLVVGADGRRFADEGAVTGPSRHSVWARALMARPDPRAWIVLDRLGLGQLPPMLFPPLVAATPEALADLCGIDAAGLAATLRDPLAPPRSGGLPPLRPPFAAVPMVPGIAFTRHGLAVDDRARVLLATGDAAPRLFAAGTAMCGAVLGPGYLSGVGLAIAGVFGRIAGQEAALLAVPGPAAFRPLRRLSAACAAPPAEALPEAARSLNICNTCGFCSGLCAVFPAAERRPDLAAADLRHLAHLCHDCRSCAYDCQYAAPHRFAVNLPATLAELRLRDYAGNGAWAVALYLLCLLGPVLALLLARPWAEVLAAQTGPGAFYAQIPHALMAGGAGAVFGLAGLLLLVRLRLFWRQSAGPAAPITWLALRAGLRDALSLRHLGGCETRAGPVGQMRRIAHHLVAGGFGATFLATLAGFMLHRQGQLAPYPLASLPVMLGSLGGAAMLAGLMLFEARRWRLDPAPTSPAMARADRFARVQLGVLAASGMALLAARETAAMGLLLALHLGSVAGFALLLPFGKLSHGGYRLLALIRHAAETQARPRAQTRPKLDKPKRRKP